MAIDSDDFELLGVPRRFAQDRAQLDERWRRLQAQVHPDRHVTAGAAAQRVAMQWAVRVDEAYRRLRDPLRRAAYLCELQGVPIDAERNTAMPSEFLVRQMAWREALDEAGRDAAAVARLADEVASHQRAAFERLAHTLDEQGDAAGAAAQVRALMFVERFADDVAARLDALET
ncbi:Fe-S protein assembly co-chaperone HscB [Piscinibacter sakaiensis]|uniref:Co-chaperone protein HscB homolog n=1 Tax=Piscinibacter sakaiensis TaxID=1547922 RepID=A0A0K8NYV6_PISS1|nr:Fe-S protein assembly co-chaperone HscB [Piscinibacter sakaiensis]GAP35563.1 chaperone protein HscB [Piscinibacter sakaiensis]